MDHDDQTTLQTPERKNGKSVSSDRSHMNHRGVVRTRLTSFNT